MMTLIKHEDDGSSESTDALSGESSGLERRRGLRITQQRPIKVFEPTSCRYFPGETADISATGLRVQMPISAPLRPGRTLNVHVGLSNSGEALANRRQMIPARVVWVRNAQTADGGSSAKTVTLGLEFIAGIAAQ